MSATWEGAFDEDSGNSSLLADAESSKSSFEGGKQSVRSDAISSPFKDALQVKIASRESPRTKAGIELPTGNPASKIPDSEVACVMSDVKVGIFDPADFPDGTIDSALTSALRDPRERLGLLKLEQAMIDFLKSSDGYIEVGGPYNSFVVSPTSGIVSGQSTAFDRPQTTFQRCILHRLADRFCIARETGSIFEGYIRLVKLKDSKIPKRLLVDLDPSEYGTPLAETSKSLESVTIVGSSNSSNQSVFFVGSKSRNRKMKIMKRDSSGDSFKSSSNGSDSRSTPRKGRNFSDKEKAYAEARARIFSDQQAESGPSLAAFTSTSRAPLPATTPPASMSQPLQHGNRSFASIDDGTTSENEERSRAPSANSTVSKATWRNRRKEENDPDFQRGGPMCVQPQSYTADGYSGACVAGYSSRPYYPPFAEDSGAYCITTGSGLASTLQPAYFTAYVGGGRGRGSGLNSRHRAYPGNNYHHSSHQNLTRTSSEEPANVKTVDDFPALS